MTNCGCEDNSCKCKMLRTIKATVKKTIEIENILNRHKYYNNLDIERFYDMLEHYEMALSSQAIQIKLLEERINALEKDGRSPSGKKYPNYYGDFSGRN